MDKGEGLVFVDTDVFVIDELFEKDTRHPENQGILQQLPQEKCTP